MTKPKTKPAAHPPFYSAVVEHLGFDPLNHHATTRTTSPSKSPSRKPSPAAKKRTGTTTKSKSIPEQRKRA